jgi:hypothetical protein
MARKSPPGGASRYILGGISQAPLAYSTKPSLTRSTASAGVIAASTSSWLNTGSSGTAGTLPSP